MTQQEADRATPAPRPPEPDVPRAARAVLLHLRDAGTALTAAELATLLGLHVTTARVHLERLHDAGLVARVTEHSGRRGRPTVRYRPTGADRGAVYEQMIDVLAQVAARPGDPDAALEAGAAWATAIPLPTGPAATRLTALAEHLGFEPEPCDVGLRLRGCPFRAAARRTPQVVCRVHLGLIQAALAGADDAAQVSAGLVPFATPETCHLTLAPVAGT